MFYDNRSLGHALFFFSVSTDRPKIWGHIKFSCAFTSR